MSTKNVVLFRFRSDSGLQTFQKILSKWKKYSLNKNVVEKIVDNFFFLESSETYADPNSNEIGAKI